MAKVWRVVLHVARESAPYDTTYSIPVERAATNTDAINAAFDDYYHDYRNLGYPATVKTVIEDESAGEGVASDARRLRAIGPFLAAR